MTDQTTPSAPADSVTSRGERPTWDEWALGIADAVATRADCTRRKVGAVVMAPDHRILATGYNGAPAGKPGCLTDGACARGRLTYEQLAADSPYVDTPAPCNALHAEENAILHTPAAQRAGATIYITCAPCPNCLRFLAGSGLARAVWPVDVLNGQTVVGRSIANIIWDKN